MENVKHLDKNELVEILDKMELELGTDELLLALVKALDSDTLQDTMKYIDRVYELNLF